MAASRNNSFPEICFASLSEQGPVRANNEDALLALPEDGCFAVADGMGGGDAGEEASRLVVDAVKQAVAGSALESPGERKYVLQQTLHKVHGAIASYARGHGFASMGSTLVLLLFDSWNSGRALICHVGDSRAYCLRGNELFRITDDHNVMTEMTMRNNGNAAKIAPGSLGNVLTRVIGAPQVLFPEWTSVAVCPGDILLLCSDGVSSMVTEEAIKAALARDVSPETMAESLKKAVYVAGAKDNFSMICLVVKQLNDPVAVSRAELEESNFLLKISEERIDYGTT